MENANFSVPELRDLQASVRSVAAFGDSSTLEFTLVGLGEPRVVRAGVVGGSSFAVVGLRPVAGRLIGPADDGPSAAGAVVLTHRFWTSTLNADDTVIGRTRGRRHFDALAPMQFAALGVAGSGGAVANR